MADTSAEKERSRQAEAARIDIAILSRRELLRRSGIGLLTIGVAPALLAGCGGGDEAAAPKATGTIDFLSFEGYDLPDQTAAWRKENGVEFNSTYIVANEDIPPKLKVGGAAYDLSYYGVGFKDGWAPLGLWLPIDEAKVPNIEKLFPFFKSDVLNAWVDPDGTRTGVPFTWGSVGLTWDDAALPGGLESFYDLLDPKFKDKIGLPDDAPSNFVLAVRMLGYDTTTLTQDQYKEVTDLLRQFVKQAKTVSPGYGDVASLLASGEIVAAFSGWAAINSFAAGAGKDTVKTSIPKEGGYSFADAYMVASTADNADTVLAFINHVLEPEVNAAAADFLVGGVTVEGSVELLSPATASLYSYENIEASFERAPLFKLPPFESDQYVTYQDWLDTWAELKAGA
ncbi:MAG: extracellular solute-binding protein [Actinobacteria bacterium]|nr:extracellular solute-binding protein [Actinomycetota bacterium]